MESNVVKGEMSAKTTYQKSAKGAISIISSLPEYVELENTGKKEEDISNYVIKKIMDGQERIVYKLSTLTIPPGQKTKIYVKGFKDRAGANDLVATFASWGIGANTDTTLYNDQGEARASYIQKTVYSS